MNAHTVETTTDASEIESIRKRAYELWEEAGKPKCDGKKFWIRAENELFFIKNDLAFDAFERDNLNSTPENKIKLAYKRAVRLHESCPASFSCLNQSDIAIVKEKYEKIIIQDAELAYNYARSIIKGRWNEAEQTISACPEYAFNYAINIIRGRWEEAEEFIAKDPKYAYHYARLVIKGKLPEDMHNIIIMNGITGLSRHVKDYFIFLTFLENKKLSEEIDDKIIKNYLENN